MNDAPTILLIESSGDFGGAGVARGHELLAEARIDEARSHGSLLVSKVDEALMSAGLQKSDLDIIAVNRGPGSYTGLRIGVSAAETIGLALEIPVIGVDGLEVMAWQALHDGDWSEGTLIAALDARQGEVSAQAFERSGDSIAPTSKLRRLSASDCSGLAASALAYGQAAPIYRDSFPEGFAVHAEEVRLSPQALLSALWRQRGAGFASHAKAGTRIKIEYFRPVTAKTIKEREAEADAKREAKRSKRPNGAR